MSIEALIMLNAAGSVRRLINMDPEDRSNVLNFAVKGLMLTLAVGTGMNIIDGVKDYANEKNQYELLVKTSKEAMESSYAVHIEALRGMMEGRPGALARAMKMDGFLEQVQEIIATGGPAPNSRYSEISSQVRDWTWAKGMTVQDMKELADQTKQLGHEFGVRRLEIRDAIVEMGYGAKEAEDMAGVLLVSRMAGKSNDVAHANVPNISNKVDKIIGEDVVSQVDVKLNLVQKTDGDLEKTGLFPHPNFLLDGEKDVGGALAYAVKKPFGMDARSQFQEEHGELANMWQNKTTSGQITPGEKYTGYFMTQLDPFESTAPETNVDKLQEMGRLEFQQMGISASSMRVSDKFDPIKPFTSYEVIKGVDSGIVTKDGLRLSEYPDPFDLDIEKVSDKPLTLQPTASRDVVYGVDIPDTPSLGL